MDTTPSFAEFQELVERYLLYIPDDELLFKKQVEEDTYRFDKIFRNNEQLEEIADKISTVKSQQEQLDKILKQISCAQAQMERKVKEIELKQDKSAAPDTESQRAKICDLMQKIFTELENLKSGNQFLISKYKNSGGDSIKEVLSTISQTIIYHFRCCELIHAKITEIQDKLEKIP